MLNAGSVFSTVIWFEKLIYWKPLPTVCLQLLILSALKAQSLYYWKGLYLVLGSNKIVYHIFLSENTLKRVWVLLVPKKGSLYSVSVFGFLIDRKDVKVQWSNHTKSALSCCRLLHCWTNLFLSCRVICTIQSVVLDLVDSLQTVSGAHSWTTDQEKQTTLKCMCSVQYFF